MPQYLKAGTQRQNFLVLSYGTSFNKIPHWLHIYPQGSKCTLWISRPFITWSLLISWGSPLYISFLNRNSPVKLNFLDFFFFNQHSLLCLSGYVSHPPFHFMTSWLSYWPQFRYNFLQKGVPRPLTPGSGAIPSKCFYSALQSLKSWLSPQCLLIFCLLYA